MEKNNIQCDFMRNIQREEGRCVKFEERKELQIECFLGGGTYIDLLYRFTPPDCFPLDVLLLLLLLMRLILMIALLEFTTFFNFMLAFDLFSL